MGNFYNGFLLKCVIPLGDLFFKSGYLKYFKTWNAYDVLPEDRLLQLQQDGIKDTLKYALEKVPYYRQQHISYNPNLSPEENLKQFPILTKDVLRKEKEQLVAADYPVAELKKNFSSGSSGKQSYSYSAKGYSYFLQAGNTHWYSWSGYKIGDPVLQFGISPNRTLPKKLKDIFYRVTYVNAFSLSETDHLAIYKKLKKNKIAYIIGYPSAINQMAKTFIKHNLQYPVKGVISLGDKLFDHYVTNFNTVFNSPKIVDTYGCAEGLMMGCKFDVPYYYIMAPHVHIEIVDDNGNAVLDGELGNVLVTCFTNKAMPFIRYQLGDLAIKLPKEEYPKDRLFKYPLLKKVVGRETDIVKTITGKQLVVHSFTGIFEYYPEISQYRIIQDTLAEITVEYIVDNYFNFNTKVLVEIKEKLDKLTDAKLGVNFTQVTSIPPTPSGKPQIIVSNLK